MKPKKTVMAIIAVTVLALGALPLTATAQMAHHSGKQAAMGGKMGGGSMMGGHGGKGGKMGHGFEPHNAAVHFLKMDTMLDLDAGQIERLQTLRDAFISANAGDKARLKAAESDLKRLLHADTIDMDKVEQKLQAIGKLEGKLWRAFATQLREIKAQLTDDQKARMRTHHQRMQRR